MAQAVSAVSTICPHAVQSEPLYIPIISAAPHDYVRERETPELSRSQVAADIASAEISDVASVVAMDLASGRSWDASVEVAEDVLDIVLRERGYIPDWCRDFLEHHLGWHVIAAAEREAA